MVSVLEDIDFKDAALWGLYNSVVIFLGFSVIWYFEIESIPVFALIAVLIGIGIELDEKFAKEYLF